jgi:phosphoribosylaminoimidazole-succinocarboxamide synthase
MPDLNMVNRGKVRDIFDLGEHLLLVTSDRLSAFDVIMNEGIPKKGQVLNQFSIFWFNRMADIIPNHIVATEVDDFPVETHAYRDQLEGRSMLVKKAKPLPIECIVRGYVSGSGWKEYQQQGSICGIKLPEGLLESSQLEKPLFTPSTKAELGDHDENISFAEAVKLCGSEITQQVSDISIEIYSRARDFAREKGIIIADTKFEFGLMGDGSLIWIDEALSPDSSRFWPKELYKPGGPQPSFDKQFVRDYLETLDWNKQAPPPPLPAEIVEKTSEKYQDALFQLTGIKL